MADIERLKSALRKADAAGNEEDARRLAAAIRQAQAGAQPQSRSVGDIASSARDSFLGGVQQFNTGGLGMIPMPGRAREFLNEQGITSGEPAQGLTDKALRGAGEAATFATAGMAGLGARAYAGGQQAANAARSMAPGVRAAADRAGRTILDTAARHPASFAALELFGGAGAGAGAEAGRRAGEGEDISRGQQQALEVTGGLLGGLGGAVAPGASVRGAQGATDAITRNLLPFTERGGRQRASSQLQRTAENPEAAAQAALEGPEGATPARRTGDRGLMALEQRVLDDNPPLRAQVRDELSSAQRSTEEAFTGQFGQPRGAGDWERTVMERVSAPGTRIEPGDTDQMLTQAFNSFEPAYATARGHRIDTSNMGQSIESAINNPDTFASESVRGNVTQWVNSQLRNLQSTRAAEDGSLASDDILNLRQAVRTRQRALAGTTDADSQQAREVFGNVEQRLTQMLEEQLPSDVQQTLRQVDGQYRQYKVVEDAVTRGGEGALSPERMSDAIRRSAQSPGRFARGDDQQLRQLALSGRGVESVLGKPDVARRMTRGMSEADLQPVKADFVQTLFRRASSPDADGISALSGRKLRAEIDAQSATARALGISDAELQRMTRMSEELVTLQRGDPGAASRLMDDELSVLVELGGRLAGAKAGQRASGGGIGSSLVLAQYMSRKAVDSLRRLTSGKAEQLMTDAVQDPKLYAALMAGPTTSVARRREGAQQLEAWLLSNAADPIEEQQQPESPNVPGLMAPEQSAPSGGLLDFQGAGEPSPLRSLLD